MYKKLQGCADRLRTTLTSTYRIFHHICRLTLVDLRDALVERMGAIAQELFQESAARYPGGRRFADLNIPGPVADLRKALPLLVRGR